MMRDLPRVGWGAAARHTTMDVPPQVGADGLTAGVRGRITQKARGNVVSLASSVHV
jgi:hypothetical protein